MPIDLEYNLYGKILHRLRRAYNRPEADVCAHLKPRFHELREAYHVGFVNVAYRDFDLAAAYMLGYFPNYVKMSSATLQQLAGDLGSSPTCVVVCGGPLPEMLGLLSVLHAPRALRVIAPDLHSDEWRWAQELCADVCRSYVRDLHVQVQPVRCDLLVPLTAEQLVNYANVDIVIVQNCLNEIGNQEQFIANVLSISEGVKTGGYIVFADQANYDTCLPTMVAMREVLVGRGFQVVDDCTDRWELQSSFVFPPAVRDQFFEVYGTVNEVGQFVPPQRARTRMDLRSLVARKL